MVNQLHMNDFGKFYYGTVEYLQGGDLYAPSPATLCPVTKSEKKQLWDMNPPYFHLIILPLAILPPGLALAFWMLASILCLIVSLRLIRKELRISPTPWQKQLIFLGIIAFAGTTSFAVTGQLSFLFLLPFTLAWLEARRGCWDRSGFYLGICISLKLFMLIFLPYLFLRRRFRSAAIALGTVLAAFALGLLVFGVDSYRHWLQVLAGVDWEWAAMNGSLKGFLTRVFASSPYYEPLYLFPGIIQPLWLILSFLLGSTTMIVSGWGSSPSALDRSFAILLAGSQLISPLGWIYYFILLMGPLTALLAVWLQESEGNWRSVPLTRTKMYLLFATVPALIWPFSFILAFQPYAWATILPGSCYFFALLVIWISIVIDWYQKEISEIGLQTPTLTL